MKRTVIGSVLMITGALISLTIIIRATFLVPQITSWHGSKLWFAIYGAAGMGGSAQSLFVGTPFTIGLVLFVVGIIILAIEYFSANSYSNNIRKLK